MRVDPNNPIDQVYQSTVRNKPVNQEESSEAVNTQKEMAKDKVEISQKAAEYDSVDAAKDRIVNEVEKGTHADRLRQLKADIESGAYYVSSQDIAGAMLGVGNKDE